MLSGQTLVLIERRYRVVQMRREGYRIDEIATTLNCDPSTVSRDLREVLQLTVRDMMETTEEARVLELQRLDEIMKRFYPLAAAGDMGAAAMVLQIGDRRRKLLALDKPEAKGLEQSGIREYVGVDVDQV
jgi:AraC-like DNA-binding protein